jgi:hypothetical protein
MIRAFVRIWESHRITGGRSRYRSVTPPSPAPAA